MRSLSILLLVVLGILGVCAVKPYPPTDLEVALIKPDTVLLGWKWKTDTVTVKNVKFKIEATADGKPSIAQVAEGILKIELVGLEPNTDYKVSITALMGDEISAPLTSSFTTLAQDYPAPTAVGSVIKNHGDGEATYTTSWTLSNENPLSKEVTRFSISYCTQTCKEWVVDNGIFTYDVQLFYLTDYQLTVTAEYDLPVDKNLTLTSEAISFKTERGNSGPVKDFNVEQTPDTLDLKISWSPPEHPSGEIKFYILQLSKAAGDGSLIVNKNLTELNYLHTISASSPDDDKFVFKIAAVNDAEEEKWKIGKFLEFPYTIKKPEPPIDIKWTKRTANSLSFEIQRESTRSDLFFRITDTVNRFEQTSNRTVTLDKFKPYTKVQLQISCCVPLVGKDALCGSEKDFEIETNVAAPSTVVAFKVNFKNPAAVFSWEVPETPAGPINGYTLVITDKKTNENKEIEKKGEDFEHIFEDVKNCTRYEASIKAFNTDLVTGEKLSGNPVVLLLHRMNCSVTPNPPTALEVAKMSPETVVVGWQWSTNDLDLDDVKFEIKATNPKVPDQPITVSVDGKLVGELKGLQLDTDYDVTVTAMLIGEPARISGALTGSFKTLAKDYPAPSEVTYIPKQQKEDKATIYTISWKFDKENALNENLTRFDISQCAGECITEPVDKNALSFDVSLKYFTMYTVTVTAVYELPAGQNRTIEATKVEIMTEQGKPGPVKDILVKQAADTLDLVISWSAPERPNAKIIEYFVQLAKASGGDLLVNTTVKDLTVSHTIPAVSPVDDAYIFRIAAVSDSTDEKIRVGTFLDKPYTILKPAPPEVTRKSATQNSLVVEIKRDSARNDLSFSVRDSTNKVTKTPNKTVTFDGYTAFVEVAFKVATCLPLDKENVLCGDEKSFTFVTNVGKPSAVQELTVTMVDNKPKLTWKIPATPAGKIDGYKINITEKVEKAEPKEVDVAAALEYTFDGAQNCTKYDATVTAYNNDLDTGAEIKGESESIIVSAFCDKGGLSGGIIALIVILVLGTVGGAGGAFYYFKMR